MWSIACVNLPCRSVGQSPPVCCLAASKGLLMAQEPICASLPVLLVAYCVLRGLRMRPRDLAHLQHVDLQFIETRVLKQKAAESRQFLVPGQQFVSICACVSGLLHNYRPGSSPPPPERRVCLEDTKKDSSASGASSRSGADWGPAT
jgi:hypothetical protein